MKPIGFKEQNCLLAADQPEYISLPAYKTGDGQVISCWSMSWWERLKVLWSGRIWTSQLTFNSSLQPQLLDVDSPFIKDEETP